MANTCHFLRKHGKHILVMSSQIHAVVHDFQQEGKLFISFGISVFGMTKHLKEDCANYLKNWLDSLKESPEFIKTTLTDVKKASHMINQHIDAMQLKIDQEQSQEAEQKQEKAPTMYYA